MAIDTVNCNGIGNLNLTQVESIITVERLKATFLFGKVFFVDHLGNPLTDEAIQIYINYAISLLEMDLDIAIMPRQKVEYKDYNLNDYYDWGYMQLNNYPVITIDQLNIVYTKNATEFETVLNIPEQWIRLDPGSGIIRLIPNNKFPGRLAVGQGGSFFPELFNRHMMVPHMWQIVYHHGFKPGCIPALINAAIGLLASLFVLNTLGDLIIGAGVAATSLSLDGLSQSIQTTASAENHGFSSLILDYGRQLYGDRTRGTSGMIEILRKYYKGGNLNII